MVRCRNPVTTSKRVQAHRGKGQVERRNCRDDRAQHDEEDSTEEERINLVGSRFGPIPEGVELATWTAARLSAGHGPWRSELGSHLGRHQRARSEPPGFAGR